MTLEETVLTDFVAKSDDKPGWINKRRFHTAQLYTHLIARRSPALHPDDEPELVRVFLEQYTKGLSFEQYKYLMKTIRPGKAQRRWMAHTLRGAAATGAAWEIRGGGPARSISGDAWKRFRDHIADARRELETA